MTCMYYTYVHCFVYAKGTSEIENQMIIIFLRLKGTQPQRQSMRAWIRKTECWSNVDCAVKVQLECVEESDW